MDKERFEKQLAFILEVDKEKNILRQSHLSGYVRQENDADMLGVVESCYANWEQGRTEPNIEMLRKLGEIFKINTDDLING